MTHRDTSRYNLRTFLNEMSAAILAVISFISGVFGFIKLFADKDAGLIAFVSLTVGILLLFAVCLYYARFWRPEREDDREFASSPVSQEQVQAQKQKQRQRSFIRRTAIAGLFAIPVLVVSGVAGWLYVQNLPPRNVIILVADFDGPDAKVYGVTETVIRQLRQATEKYPDVEVQALNKSVTEQEGSKVAQIEGKRRKAAIVLWGWYRTPGDVVPVSVHFEVLHPVKELFNLGQSASGSIQQATIADLRSFSLQSHLSNEMTYLSLFVLGMARRAAGNGDEAIARFSDALRQTKEPFSSLNQSVVYFYRGLTYLLKGESDRALADFTEAIKLQPALGDAYVNRAMLYRDKGDQGRALADANEAVRLKPHMPAAYNNRGLIYLQTEDYDRAIADFDETLKVLANAHNAADAIQPDGIPFGTISSADRAVPAMNFLFTELSDYIVYINRGSAYLSKGDPERALADFDHAIKLRPGPVFGYVNRAAAYFAKKDYDHALADLDHAIKVRPDFALLYGKRASIYYQKGDYPRALADFNQAIKLQPDSGFFYDARGGFYANRDDPDRAIADFGEAIRLQPDSISPYLYRGTLYRKQGHYDRALADFNEAIKRAPENAEAYNSRGWTYAEIGKFDRALDDLNQALRLKPDEANFYDSRGFAYAGKGQHDRAIADYDRALKLKPDADYAYYHRAMAYRAMGDDRRAIADFNRAVELTKDSKRRQDAEKQLQEMRHKERG